MLLTADHLRQALRMGREQCTGLIAAMGPHDKGTVTLFMQHHPDGPDGVVDQAVYLLWAAAQPSPPTTALELALQLPSMHPVVNVHRNGGCEPHAFTDDAVAAAVYLELAARLLPAA